MARVDSVRIAGAGWIRGFSAVVWAGFCGTGILATPVVSAGSLPVPKEIQRAYDERDYQKTVEEIDKLDQEKSAAPDVLRLKIRALLKLANPKDALAEYGKLETSLRKEDVPLLREVALSFIVVLLKDTALGFLVTYQELLYYARYIGSQGVFSRPIVPSTIVVAAIYITLCLLLTALANFLERRQRRSKKALRIDREVEEAVLDAEVV